MLIVILAVAKLDASLLQCGKRTATGRPCMVQVRKRGLARHGLRPPRDISAFSDSYSNQHVADGVRNGQVDRRLNSPVGNRLPIRNDKNGDSSSISKDRA